MITEVATEGNMHLSLTQGSGEVWEFGSPIVCNVTTNHHSLVACENGSVFLLDPRVFVLVDMLQADTHFILPPLFSGMRHLKEVAIASNQYRLALRNGSGDVQVWEWNPHYHAWLKRDVFMRVDREVLGCHSGLRWEGKNIAFVDNEGGDRVLRHRKLAFCDPSWSV